MRVAGLKEINTAMGSGMRTLPGIQEEGLKELARLIRERATLTEQRENWQKRIDRIDARLIKIVAREKILLKSVAEEDPVPPAQTVEETGPEEKIGEMLMQY